MAITNTVRNFLLKIFFPKFQPSILFTSSDCKKKDNFPRPDHKDKREPEPKHIMFPENPQKKRKNQLRRCKVLLRGPVDYCLVSEVPLEITCSRVARIYQPRKNAMQSGTMHIRHWEIDFDTKERWENPLMGWASSGDSLSNVKFNFATKEEAIDYCKKNNMKYWIQESKTFKKFKIRSYAINFHHKNRTRISTK